MYVIVQWQAPKRIANATKSQCWSSMPDRRNIAVGMIANAIATDKVFFLE